MSNGKVALAQHTYTHTKNSNIQNFHPLKSIAEKIYIKKYLIGTKQQTVLGWNTSKFQVYMF